MNCEIGTFIYYFSTKKITFKYLILSGLNPRGVLDFSPLYILSKGIFEMQVIILYKLKYVFKLFSRTIEIWLLIRGVLNFF